MPQSLQQITDAWGNWMSNQLSGGGIRFTASTNYGAHSGLGGFSQYQVSAAAGTLSYGQPQTPGVSSQASPTTTFVNKAAEPQTHPYSQSVTTQRNFIWVAVEPLSVDVKVNTVGSVPPIAQLNSPIATTFDMSQTTGNQEAQAQSWTTNTPLTVPPHTTLSVSLVVDMASYTVAWESSSLLVGEVAVFFNDKVNGHWLWFYPIETVFNDCVANNLIDTTGYQIVEGGVLAQALGTFTGSQGVDSHLSQLVVANEPAVSQT